MEMAKTNISEKLHAETHVVICRGEGEVRDLLWALPIIHSSAEFFGKFPFNHSAPIYASKEDQSKESLVVIFYTLHL